MKKAIMFLLSLSLAISSCAPKAQQGANAKSKKTNVAIVTFGDEPEGSNALNGLSTKLTEAIVNSGKYIAVNRSEDILKQLGKEHWYQRSDAVDSNQIKELGKQLGVQYLCIVQSSKVMGEYMLEAKFVDVVTAATAPGMMGSELSSLKDTKELMRVAEVLVTKLLGSGASPLSQPPVASANTFVDSRDGKEYKIVKIGSQTWMAENLNYETNGSKCYDNNSWYCTKYGRLYDWNTAKNVCPSGWHLSSKMEWDMLNSAIEGDLWKKLRAKSGWNNNGNGTDDYGFSALPGGGGSKDGSFDHLGQCGHWWSTNNKYYTHCWHVKINIELWGDGDESSLLSVRCIKD